jgi:UDP-glucose 4-epimerase
MTKANRPANLLITGGAGYIGSHVVRACLSAGHRVVVLDRFCTGHLDNVAKEALLIRGEVADDVLVRRLLRQNSIDAVIHLAGSLIAEESVLKPDVYYQNNTLGTLALARACIAEGVKAFVYSSSAAVYGQPRASWVREDDPTRPMNPYGRSKLFAEMMLEDLAAATALRCVSLRYFNVAGVDPTLEIGPRNPKIRSLFTAVCDTVLGLQPALFVYGKDCRTPDGSCVRDYIEVRDLASAHTLAIDHLLNGGGTRVFNCGYSRGVSVFEVVAAAEKLIGRALPVIVKPRRVFDPEMVVADPSRLVGELSWKPRYGDLSSMVETSLAWRAKTVSEQRAAVGDGT